MTAKLLLIGALAALGLAAGPAPASAQGFLDGVLGLLGVAPEKPPIDYRERAPLVVPKSQQLLREPQAPRAQRNPAWPNDPDVAARRQADDERNSPVVRNENPEMSPRALRAGPRTATNNYRGQPLGAAPENNNNDLVIGPARQMREIDAREQSTANLRPGDEPERRSLIDPPTGYRKPTEVVRTGNEPVRNVDQASTRDFVVQQRRN